MKLCYILSSGRSGSTILEMLLNCSSEAFTLGEFHLLFLENNINAKCGCGNYIKNDIIWSDLIRKHSSSQKLFSKYRKTFTSKTGHYGRVIRTSKLIQIIFNINTNDILRYSKLNLLILQDLSQKLKDKKLYIDSSKDYYRYYDLYKSDLFNLYPIHLYKSSQSFVYSNIKSSKGFQRFYLIIRFSLRWLIENTIIKLILIKSKNKLVISYEELIFNYKKVIPNIYKKFDIEYFENFKFQKNLNHGIAGNNIPRFQSKEIIFDDKFKKGLSQLEKYLISLLTFNIKSFK